MTIEVPLAGGGDERVDPKSAFLHKRSFGI